MIRRMEAGDVSAVASLERICFHTPWSEELLRSGLDSRLDRYLVLEEEGTVVAYCAIRLIGDEGEIQRIAVLPERRGKGYARKLMDEMLEISRQNEVTGLILEVRAGNRAAIGLYKSYGFVKEGERRGYYACPTEDAWLMRRELISSNYQSNEA